MRFGREPSSGSRITSFKFLTLHFLLCRTDSSWSGWRQLKGDDAGPCFCLSCAGWRGPGKRQRQRPGPSGVSVCRFRGAAERHRPGPAGRRMPAGGRGLGLATGPHSEGEERPQQEPRPRSIRKRADLCESSESTKGRETSVWEGKTHAALTPRPLHL